MHIEQVGVWTIYNLWLLFGADGGGGGGGEDNMDVVCAAEWLRVVRESDCSRVTATPEQLLLVFPGG